MRLEPPGIGWTYLGYRNALKGKFERLVSKFILTNRKVLLMNEKDSATKAPTIHSLAKNRLAIVQLLFAEAKKNRGLSTGILQLEPAAKAVGLKPLNFKQTVFRLCQTGHVARRGYNAGGSVYTLHPNVFAEMAAKESGNNAQKQDEKKPACWLSSLPCFRVNIAPCLANI